MSTESDRSHPSVACGVSGAAAIIGVGSPVSVAPEIPGADHRQAAPGISGGTFARGPRIARIGAVTIGRIAWLVTALACVIAGLALLLSGYQGYAAVVVVVGASAAINLL
jgi:hypothetical protein